MPEEKSKNHLAKLMKDRGGFIPIRKALEILGPEEYTRCLAELLELPEEDEEYTSIFWENGDGPNGTPSHICFSNAAMERFFAKVDEVLEAQGHLSPRTKGFPVN